MNYLHTRSDVIKTKRKSSRSLWRKVLLNLPSFVILFKFFSLKCLFLCVRECVCVCVFFYFKNGSHLKPQAT